MVYKKREVEKDVLTLARERVALMYERYDHVVVSFSGGKDSTVVLNLCYEEAQRRGQILNVVHWDEEVLQPETVDYVRRVSQMPGVNMRWLCWPIVHPNACSKEFPTWYPWAPEVEERWVRPFPVEGLKEPAPQSWLDSPEARLHNAVCNNLLFPHSMGTIGMALGIRAQESMRRYRSVAQRVEENWIAQDSAALGKKRNGIYICKPIFDWRTEDVWTAPQKFGWDYNAAYDVMDSAGMTIVQQRICAPYGEEPLNGLWTYSVCWPQMWDAMIDRVPGCATAARYAKTPLYGSGARLKEPTAGTTWKETVKADLMKWPEKERRMIADRIRKEIETHNRKTNNAPIPDTIMPGILSWQFLAQIARRGDLKKRKDKIGAADPKFDKAAYKLKIKEGRSRVATASRKKRKAALQGAKT